MARLFSCLCLCVCIVTACSNSREQAQRVPVDHSEAGNPSSEAIDITVRASDLGSDFVDVGHDAATEAQRYEADLLSPIPGESAAVQAQYEPVYQSSEIHSVQGGLVGRKVNKNVVVFPLD